MAALAILATGLLAILLVRNETLKMAAEAENLLHAVRLADQKLTEFELSGFPEASTGGAFVNDPGYQWQVRIEPVSLAMRATVARVDLIVEYPALSGGPRTFMVTTCTSRE
ncbi:MAG: hypothetical protein HYU36_11820 [Planctomycetes bacterium]|nr:hypothetical protein [Planctomycetota bacterium]